METLLIALILILVLIFAVPLAVFAAGIRRQEHAGSLTARPRGLSAAITRRVVGLRTPMTATIPARPARPAASSHQSRPL
jgi:hypothetical protein